MIEIKEEDLQVIRASRKGIVKLNRLYEEDLIEQFIKDSIMEFLVKNNILEIHKEFDEEKNEITCNAKLVVYKKSK